MDNKGKLHIVMLPWLAMGHIIPFLELSKCLARKGHKISFVSTGRNIKRLPKIPSEVSPLINLVEVSLPYVDNLPQNAEATIDLPPDKVHYLKKAFDGLKDQLFGLLEDSAPDWIIQDFTSHWLPPFAAKLGIPCAFFCLFNAAAISFFGPPALVINNTGTGRDSFISNEDLTVVPKWTDFPSNLNLRYYELLRVLDTLKENVSETPDGLRYGLTLETSDVVFIRTCYEFEQFWLHFLQEKVLEKPVIPVGLLPPSLQESTKNDEVEEWAETKAWFDKQTKASVVYVALGTEATITQDEINILALGLEQSELPFFWVLRKPTTSVENDSYLLPTGFEDRVRDRGVVCRGWAPQVKILAHPSLGGFLTHCGWNSVIESLSFGCPLVLLPLIAEQGLNSRRLHGDKIGLEIPRDRKDGSFTIDSVAETLKTVIVDEKGEIFREKAKEMRGIFGNMELHDQYIDKLIQYLQDHRQPILTK